MRTFGYLFSCLLLVSLCMVMIGCSDDDDPDPPPPPLPTIDNINGSADPKTPVSQIIEINGSAFLDTPGTVRFLDGATPYNETPPAASWSDNSIAVEVPSGLTSGNTVQVTVITAEGESNVVDLDIVSVPSFGSASSLSWSTGVAPVMPAGRRGHKAVAVPYTDTTAYVYVAGGQTSAGSAANQNTCWMLGLSTDTGSFVTDLAWTAVAALPSERAFHALVSAHPQNSPVTLGNAYLYVVGGQALATEAPGGTDTVYFSSVNLVDGTLGSWSVAGNLPAPRLGHCAFIYHGRLYVLGGFDTSGNPVDTVYMASVGSDGTLGAFSTSPVTLPDTVGSSTAFAFGGHFYLIAGETAASTDPNDSAQGAGDIRDTWRVPITTGDLGTWVSDTKLGNERKKHVLWNVYGTVLVAEGSEKGSTGGLVASDVASDSSLDSWNGSTGPSADVFNAASALSPIFPSSGGPRFLLFGGDDFAGNALDTVWVNTLP